VLVIKGGGALRLTCLVLIAVILKVSLFHATTVLLVNALFFKIDFLSVHFLQIGG
jgi:hypothetical protein